MKRLFLFLLLLVAVYSAKPYWEKPVSKYVDLAFLEPVDETIEKVTTSEPFEQSILYITDTMNRLFHFVIDFKEPSTNDQTNVEKPALETPTNGQISIHNIEIGMTVDAVMNQLGAPIDTSINEYGERWSTYHQDYHNFMMISYDEQRKVNALYTNNDLISSKTGLRYGSHQVSVREIYGEPLTEIRKPGLVFHLNESEEFDLFMNDELYMYVFYDLHRENKVTALQLVSKELEAQRKRIYADASDALRNGFEKQLFDLTNATRVKHGVRPLLWEERAANTARKHSVDMAQNNYFSHENLQGLSPFDRMKRDHIPFRSAGENLAYGQSSSIFAHEGLMNSKGHRENILLDTYNHLGVGVAFNEDAVPYYTTNFLLK